MSYCLRIGARPSALALAQAALIARQLVAGVSGLKIELVPIKTSGDKLTNASLARVGGKGLFIRELEEALSGRRIDIAVHSMKDLPATLPSQFRIAAVGKRENPRDALITRHSTGWESMARGARLGTSSARRRFEALRVRPDLDVRPLRGNIDTRLQRLAEGQFDAVILAMAGLKRLDRIEGLKVVELDEETFVPCAGQGALAIETLAESPPDGSGELGAALAGLNHLPSDAEVTAERAFLATIGASCNSPVGAKGAFSASGLLLHGLLFSLDGARSLVERVTSVNHDDPAALGVELGQRMLAQGAAEMIGERHG